MMSMNADGWPPPVWQGGTVCKYCGVEYSPPGSHVLCTGRGSYNRGVAAERARVLRVLDGSRGDIVRAIGVARTASADRILAALRARITEATDD